jgi:hypothetical protein
MVRRRHDPQLAARRLRLRDSVAAPPDEFTLR